jgi:hypothetical protein
MPNLKVYEFSWYVALCVTRSADLNSLSAKLGLEPMDLVGMINGRTSPSKAVAQGLAVDWVATYGFWTARTRYDVI